MWLHRWFSPPLPPSPDTEITPLGAIPAENDISNLKLPSIDSSSQEEQEAQKGANALSTILPLLSALPLQAEPLEKTEAKPARFLVAKGLPTLPTKLVEKAWALQYIDMEEFLPAPRSIRMAEQAKLTPTLQESLVGAFSQFQALQQQQRHQRRVLDVFTWTRCFTLYLAVMAKKRIEMVPSMVAHLHTVLKLHQKAPKTSAWLEYDIQFRMEMAAREEQEWSAGDPWQYVSCLPGPSSQHDPFNLAEDNGPAPQGPSHTPLQTPIPADEPAQSAALGRGKRSAESNAGRLPAGGKPPAKKPKKGGTCRLFNKAPGGCPYGRECIFTHRCLNCGAADEHGMLACPAPQRFPPERSGGLM